MVFTTILRTSASKRIPLIRFRKGGNGYETVTSIDSSNVPGSSARTQIITSGLAIEDWQLPDRYRRKQLDQKEIDYINRGGPE